MRAVIQRVSEASVGVDANEVARIGRGFLALVGFGRGDDEDTLAWMARKIAALRIFPDADGRMSLGLDAVDGHVLVVSQFTLHADCHKGNRPSFIGAAEPERAHALYRRFVERLEQEIPGRVATGEFQAIMSVSLVNDGPVTIILEREAQ